MPTRPLRQCNQPGCGAAAAGNHCDAHRAPAEAERGNSAARGYGHRWRKIRAAFLREHPLCERCEAKERVTPATEPHHRLPRREGGSDDWSNLEALCHECHSEETRKHTVAKMRGTGGGSIL